MAFINPVADFVTKYVFDPCIGQICYLVRLRKNIEKLESKTRELTSKKNDTDSALATAARREGRIPTERAKEWLDSVSVIEAEAVWIKDEYEQGKTCLRRLCPDCWSRYKLSKRAVNLVEDVDYRLAMEIGALSTSPPPKRAVQLETTPIPSQRTARKALQEVLDCIHDDQIGIIGVYGMGGVGKTTIAKEVNNQLQSNTTFDIVIWVTVSSNPDLSGLQKRIGERLGLLDLSNCSYETARENLLTKLRGMKYVVILDDIWKPLSLEDVGIPRPTIENVGCKILLTSRSREVCSDMDAKPAILVAPLSKEEAWALFVEKSGSHSTLPKIKPVAEAIVECCDGLPLAIITVARAMANQLRSGGVGGCPTGVETVGHWYLSSCSALYTLKTMSWGNMELVNWCIGEGWVDRVGDLKSAINKVYTLVGRLKLACMLETGDAYEGSDLYDKIMVKMHDVVRHMALWVTSTRSRSRSRSSSRQGAKFLALPRAGLSEAPDAATWSEADRIALIQNHLKALPQLPECPKLVTLLLQGNRDLSYIPPENFFERLRALRVLDLSDTSVSSLPCSISKLENLLVLRLRRCPIRELPATFGELRRLQLLDLSGCHMIEELPIGFGGMTDLRRLHLSWIPSLTRFPPRALSRLSNLEELYIQECRLLWCIEKPGKAGGANLLELTRLRRLRVIDNLTVTGVVNWNWLEELTRSIRALIIKESTITDDALITLENSPGIRILVFEECLGPTRAPNTFATVLKIVGCREVKCVMVGEEAGDGAFRCLENLALRRLDGVESICIGVPPQGSFASLKELFLCSCSRLRSVFTTGMPQLLTSLESVFIQECDEMEKVIDDEQEIEEDAFPDLKCVSLRSLPKLGTICGRILNWPSLCTINVEKCPSLTSLPFDARSAQCLKYIRGEKEWWEGLEWADQTTKSHLQRYFGNRLRPYLKHHHTSTHSI
ncbi:disease resistance protein RPS2 [Amborella trichopoda]|nr:disease resistance protein RPS2 [Amborella trichopoda]|eukprot:XP_006844352.2 disease resistance protein RPS2 [Amborella trichopoda]